VEVRVVAVADAYADRANGTGNAHKVPKERIFTGFNAYKKLIATDVDIVLMATSPNFRAPQLAAAVEAGKHVFMEKPVAVDPPGCRSVLASYEVAKKKGLSVAAGTQRRHSGGYRKTAAAIKEGLNGKIKGGIISWCGGALWRRERDPKWDDAEYMVRNWVSFSEMSGDHLVEQHVHNIDVMLWYMGMPPLNVLGFGFRARRKTGDQYDFFSLDFEFPEGVHIHSMCRQINGTDGRPGEHFVYDGKGPGGEPKAPLFPEGCPITGGDYVQEHIDLMWSIMKQKDEPLNEAKNVAESTATAVMGRISTYTGKLISWKQMMDPDPNVHKPEIYNLTCEPTAADFEKGMVKAPKDDVIAIPGKD